MQIRSFKYFILVLALTAIPYLSNGQTDTTPDPAQLAADQSACQEHAKATSGYDPADPQASMSEQPSSREPRAGLRGAARGAARGAVAGGVVERVDDEGDHDDAAEVGAAIGAVSGGMRARRNSKQQAHSPQPPPTGDPSAYTKLYNDCMMDRGYQIQ